MEHHRDVRVDIVRNERGKPNTEIHVFAVVKLLCASHRDLFACHGHDRASDVKRESVSFSIGLAVPSGTATTRWTKIPGRWIRSGSRSPARTISSASTIVSRADIAHSGLKLRAL